MKELPLSLGFESIAIQQKKNKLKSRLDANIRSEVFRGVHLDIPMIAANMSTVTNADFAIDLHKKGALGVLHRAHPHIENYKEEVKKVAKECGLVAASIGVSDKDRELAKTLEFCGANVIFIDVAHGYSDYVTEFCKTLRSQLRKEVKIIVGNTVNTNMMIDVEPYVDAVKVGIAQGLACETKNTAGCTEKQFSATWKFKEISKQLGLPYICDGGIREPADFTKAIAAGANSIMAGSIFARCPGSAAELTWIDGIPKKLYAGMASRYVQDRWKGGLKQGTCPEGGVRYLELGESLDSLLERYSGALKSGISYGGGEDISSFQDEAEFVRLV